MDQLEAGEISNSSFTGLDSEKRIEILEMENQKIIEEFNTQRAKLKDLFLQKEGELSKKTEENILLIQEVKRLKNELDEVKTQLTVESIKEHDFGIEKRKANEEIASLQTLIHEAVEESSSTRTLYDQELQKLQSYIQHLQKNIEQLQTEKIQQTQTSQEHTLAPSVMLNALTKGLAKKLDAFGGSQDEKTEKSQDDVELLKSLVDSLNDQIKALKEKLRATDEQLQKCRECGHHQYDQTGKLTITNDAKNLESTSTNTSFDIMMKNDNLTCDMCSNYETQLVQEQQNVKELMAKVQVAEKSADRHKEELLKEIGFRKEMEEKWNEKREEFKQQITELRRNTDCTEQDLKELQGNFNHNSKEMRIELTRLTKDRERFCFELEKLQNEIETLTGKYTIHSQQLQSEIINLPNTVEELHELVLKNHQDLIIAKIGKEVAEEHVNSLKSDILISNSNIEHIQRERRIIEESSDIELKNLKKQIDRLEREKNQFLAKATDLTKKEEQIINLTDSVQRFEAQNNELKTRLHSLQDELENSETVQRDFVKLSQSLQIQLEKIRETDQQVRWQHEEDVEDCPKCHINFTNSKRKLHCRHCGQIFCISCMTKIVKSGPNMKPSKVCDVCHTILVKSSAPYFSKEPPSS